MTKKGCRMSCLRCSHRCFRFYRRCVRFAAVFVLLAGLGLLAHRETGGFSIENITANRPFNPAWQSREPSFAEREEMNRAFAQKYHYLGQGGQCFVFASEDDRYVIKFFNQKIYTIPLWHHFIPIPYVFDRYKQKKAWKREDKLMRDFFSYKIAFEELPEMTGTLFIHLNPTQDLHCTLTIADRLHIEHRLDLDRLDFVLQKKAESIPSAIVELVNARRMEKAKQIVDQAVDLVVARCRHGLGDRDPEIQTNCGIIDGSVIKIDVGRFGRDAAMRTAPVCQSELKKVIDPFNGWLKSVDVQLSEYCDEASAKALTREFGEG